MGYATALAKYSFCFKPRFAGFLAYTALLAKLALSQVPGYTVTTVAGGGTNPADGVRATSASLGNVDSLAYDKFGNLYILENIGGYVRKVSPSGIITKIAGSGTGGQASSTLGDGGPATSASLFFPRAIASDAEGTVYVADTQNNRVRKIANGIITTIAGPGSTNGSLGDGGPASGATILAPQGVAVDSLGNVYISDTNHHRIRKVALDGTISTVAGNGVFSDPLGDGGSAVKASLYTPTNIAVDLGGNLYIADTGHNRIRKVSASGLITTIAGAGKVAYSGDGGSSGSAIGISNGSSLSTDNLGNVYFADTNNARIRMINVDGVINTIAGNGTATASVGASQATSLGFWLPEGVVAGSNGTVYFSSTGGVVQALSPSGPANPLPSVAADLVTSPTDFGNFGPAALGSYVEIRGSYLASTARSWAAGDFYGTTAPTSLDGTSVTIGGQPAFISYISPGQINALVPSTSGTGQQPIVVKTTFGSSPVSQITVNGTEPGLLAPSALFVGNRQYIAAILPDGNFALPTGAIPGLASRPALPGEIVTLYGVGFGAVTPAVVTGQITATSDSLVLPLSLSIGVTALKVLYSGLVPGQVGLYQFNVTVPNLSGFQKITLTLDGVLSSQSLFLSIK